MHFCHFYFYFRYRDILFLVLDSDDHAAARRDEIARMRDEAYQVAESTKARQVASMILMLNFKKSQDFL